MDTAPFRLGPSDPARPRLTALLRELEMARRFTLSVVLGLTAEQLTARPASAKNSIGGLLAHIAAAERLMQRITTSGEPFPEGTEDDRDVFRFVTDPFEGSELSAYLGDLEVTREATRDLFAERDDAWLDQPRTFRMNPANFNYYWFHLILDEARHQGQIVLLRKYLIEGAEPDYDPYGGLAATEAWT